MARIRTYSQDTDVVSADKWIGSDSQANWQTKNFTAGAVAKFINQKGNQLQSIRFRYENGITQNKGSIIFDPAGANNVAFSSISSWIMSAFQLPNFTENISGYYINPLIKSDVLVTQCSNVSQWAVYKWDSASTNSKYTDFWDIGLTYVDGNGGLKKDEDYFISLLSYKGDSSDLHFTYVQPVTAEVWVVEHNLGKYPAVSIVDSADQQITGQVDYDSLNQCTLTFSPAPGVSGKAFFN